MSYILQQKPFVFNKISQRHLPYQVQIIENGSKIVVIQNYESIMIIDFDGNVLQTISIGQNIQIAHGSVQFLDEEHVAIGYTWKNFEQSQADIEIWNIKQNIQIQSFLTGVHQKQLRVLQVLPKNTLISCGLDPYIGVSKFNKSFQIINFEAIPHQYLKINDLLLLGRRQVIACTFQGVQAYFDIKRKKGPKLTKIVRVSKNSVVCALKYNNRLILTGDYRSDLKLWNDKGKLIKASNLDDLNVRSEEEEDPDLNTICTIQQLKDNTLFINLIDYPYFGLLDLIKFQFTQFQGIIYNKDDTTAYCRAKYNEDQSQIMVCGLTENMTSISMLQFAQINQ